MGEVVTYAAMVFWEVFIASFEFGGGRSSYADRDRKSCGHDGEQGSDSKRESHLIRPSKQWLSRLSR
jgi:hypothetical protein